MQSQALQIDIEALRALLVVIEQGSITRAAQILHLSRSAVSWRMKRLEEHVGQELIIRDGHDLRHPGRPGPSSTTPDRWSRPTTGSPASWPATI